MKALRLSFMAAAATLTVAGAARAEDTPQPAAAPAGPTTLSSPAMSASLAANADPRNADLGFLGKIYFSGQFTALGLAQDNPAAGDHKQQLDLSNAQIEVQKTDGVVQFYVQAGAYSLPSLGTPYIKAKDMPDLTFKWVPVAYLKLAPSANFNIMIGKLPTLIGAEYTFTFQNLNIARGLLWNQEPAISRGVQANFTQGPLAVSISLNDGFYSNRYSTVSGLVTYTATPKDTLAFAASGNVDRTSRASFATPVAQNNGTVWNLIWTHTDGPWVINPYLQYTTTPKESAFGLPSSASTFGGAVLAKYAFSPMFNLAGRVEYISASGSQVSLLYGPKSKAWSLTLTPTWQFKTVFIRGEASYTRLDSATAGFGLGAAGNRDSQTRGMIETGFLF